MIIIKLSRLFIGNNNDFGKSGIELNYNYVLFRLSEDLDTAIMWRTLELSLNNNYQLIKTLVDIFLYLKQLVYTFHY